MDPVGPWSAYASYNRLAGVQSAAGTGDLHHHAGAGPPPTTTAQLLTAGSFLSPPPVGYETVFSPLFHHAPGAKPSHYVTQVAQHRAVAAAAAASSSSVTPSAAASSKQNADPEYQQFFEQGGWQQNSPFGILPHESVVPTTAPAKTGHYENFNPHFAAQNLNHLNAQLAKSANRSQSPQVTSASGSASKANNSTQSNSSTFYQVPVTYSDASTPNSSKSFTTNSNLQQQQQQSCIVSSSPATKDYRVPQPPARSFIASPNAAPPPGVRQIEKTFVNKTPSGGAKSKQNDDSQSSPISFSMIDTNTAAAAVAGRVNYSGSNASAGKRFQQQPHNYRHYGTNAGTEQEFQRPKSGSDYGASATNGPDCNVVVVPRRPSPHHSQASPLGHAQSPAYPMYNSPMGSISSPQQTSNQQVTPPSPLDVSVPRPNTSQNNNVVAYPSVITRALNSDKAYAERYDRNAATQNCWDERQGRGKFNHFNATAAAGGGEQQSQQQQQQQQRNVALSITERQQAYFDTGAGHAMTLQDLSSCRGDPMSLVKNLQQSCQLPQQPPQQEVKQEVKQPAKRRKSNDKNAQAINEHSGRIPPPAHSSAGNHHQQQQNGAYFDFDRWNLAPPPAAAAKLFGAQAIHQQHQGLMVPHPHGHHPPPLPYFAPFHLAPPPQDFQTDNMPPQPPHQPVPYSDQPQQPSTSHFVQQEEQPKVVVPNIEEELNFLSEGPPVKTPQSGGPNSFKPIPNHHHPHHNQQTASQQPTIKPIEKQGVGFMSSYLKFLQGERDSSPPPASRTSRKQNWNRQSTKPMDDKTNSNGIMGPGHHMVIAQPPPPPPVITRLSQGDPQDDPRYFPLPKERKRDSFDSSDDGFSSEDDFFPKMKPSTHDKKQSSKTKGRDSKRYKSDSKKQLKDRLREEKNKERKLKELQKKLNAVVPRRESVKRAAKEKRKIMSLNRDDDTEEPAEFQDSDSDPAWTPKAKDEDDVEMVMASKGKKKGKRGRPRNLITAAAEGAGIKEYDGYSSDGSKSKQAVPPTLEDNIAASLPNRNLPSAYDNPFKPGDFVAIKSELKHEWPAIWRVDGKSLLQKYEHFEQNGTTLYRNISAYTSWSPENKKLYTLVPVKYITQGQTETIVEFLRNEMTIIDPELQDRCMRDSEIYQDNFEVYIQTLISQALDNNFLTEIFQEQDEYFLSNVKTIDDVTEEKKKALLALVQWPASLQTAVCTWPCINVVRGGVEEKDCCACGKAAATAVRMLMYGQPYNATTLEGCPPDPNAISEKDFLVCRICASRVELMNKITHQKYLMYIECAKRVSEKRSLDPAKDTTCILNELLADESWLNQLFLDVRTSWSEVDCIEHSLKVTGNSVQ